MEATAVTLSVAVALRNLDDVSDSRPSALGARLDEVCSLRGFTERAWSLSAGLSEKYLAVQRVRASGNPAFVMPEHAAARLAAAANVHPQWLRHGTGERDAEGAEARTIIVPRLNPRDHAVKELLRLAEGLMAARDHAAVAVLHEAIGRLLPAPHAAADTQNVESGQRPKVVVGGG